MRTCERLPASSPAAKPQAINLHGINHVTQMNKSMQLHISHASARSQQCAGFHLASHLCARLSIPPRQTAAVAVR